MKQSFREQSPFVEFSFEIHFSPPELGAFRMRADGMGAADEQDFL